MTKSAFLNARLEPSVKSGAEKILKDLGLSASDAINLFYRQIMLHHGLPFDVRLPNQETLEALAEDPDQLPRYQDSRKMLDDILSDS